MNKILFEECVSNFEIQEPLRTFSSSFSSPQPEPPKPTHERHACRARPHHRPRDDLHKRRLRPFKLVLEVHAEEAGDEGAHREAGGEEGEEGVVREEAITDGVEGHKDESLGGGDVGAE